jgi:hypothetical protein
MPPIEKHESQQPAEKQQNRETPNHDSGLTKFAQDVWQGGSNAWSAIKDTASTGLHDLQLVGDSAAGAVKSVATGALDVVGKVQHAEQAVLMAAGGAIVTGAKEAYHGVQLVQDTEKAALVAAGGAIKTFAKDHPEAADIGIDVLSTVAGVGAAALASETGPGAIVAGIGAGVVTKNALRAALGKDVTVESVVTGALDGVAAYGLEAAAAKVATRYGVGEMIEHGVSRIGLEPATNAARYAARTLVPMEHGASGVSSPLEAAAAGMFKSVSHSGLADTSFDSLMHGAVKGMVKHGTKNLLAGGIEESLTHGAGFVAKDALEAGVHRVAMMMGTKAGAAASPITKLLGESGQQSAEAGIEKISHLVAKQIIKAPDYVRDYTYSSAGHSVVANAKQLSGY